MGKILNLPVEISEDDRFFCTITEFKKMDRRKKELRMESFYHMMRKKYNILIDKDGKPKGGKWNYDIKNRKSLPKNHPDIPKTITTQT